MLSHFPQILVFEEKKAQTCLVYTPNDLIIQQPNIEINVYQGLKMYLYHCELLH